jgi:periplasmic protein TonB
MRNLAAALTVALLAVACATAPTKAVDVPIPSPTRPALELAQQLKAPDAESRAVAAWALAGAGTVTADVSSALNEALKDPDARVREGAVWAIGHVRSRDRSSGTKASGPSDETPPRVIYQTKPVYPKDAFDKKVQGTVLVEILISEAGTVSHAEVRQSIPGLDQAALDAVRNWRFVPTKRKGAPIPTFAQAPVKFRIE